MSKISRTSNKIIPILGLTNIKNPISQILGIVLRKARIKYYEGEPDSIARFINIQPTYYRAVEAGTFNLHISHALKLAEAFSKFSYEGLLKILGTITVIDVFIKDEMQKAPVDYYVCLEAVLEKLSTQDETIKMLCLKLFKNITLSDFEGLNHDKASVFILEHQLDNVILDFLENYTHFSKNPVQRQISYSEEFFNDIPTHQIELFDHVKEFALKQPSVYTSLTSLSWEANNRKLFKSLYILDTQPERLTGSVNLTNYRYEFLWDTQFEKLRIAFISDELAETYLKLFKQHLKQSLEKCYRENENPESKKIYADMLERFENIINQKLKIICIPNKKGDEYKTTIMRIDKKPYNAVWFFSLTNHLNVGVRAILEKTHAEITRGDYLTFSETVEMSQKIINIWEND